MLINPLTYIKRDKEELTEKKMSAPIKNTCPDIDAIISSMKEAYGLIEYVLDKAEELEPTLSKQLNDTLAIIEPLTSKRFNPLEDLRDANYELRQWGEKMEEQVRGLEEDISELQEEINNL